MCYLCNIKKPAFHTPPIIILMIKVSYKSLLLQPAALIVTLLITGAASTTSAQSKQRSPNAVLAQAIKTLTDEARQAKETQQLPRQKADFAKTFNQTLPCKLVSRKIIRQINRDDFVDAYVRWQLTSFNPTLPELDDREFARFVSSLPKLLDHPRADKMLLSDINKAIRVGILDEKSQEQLSSKITEYTKMTSVASALNLPNTRFRTWILSQLSNTSTRPIQLKLDQLAKTVQAGWPVDRIKTQLDKLFEKSDRDKSFTLKQRQTVARQAQMLIGMNRVFLARANITDGTISADFGDSGVYDFEVRRWTRSILHN